jgi:hypothetical protein
MYVGEPKIPGIVKKIYLKYLYKFETLISFEVLPLRLDAAIPAPLPMLETLSKIFKGNAIKGRQRFSLTLCNVTKLPVLQILLHPQEPNKSQGAWSGKWGGDTTTILFLAKRKTYVDDAEVQRESLAALDIISFEDFRQCFQHWERCWDCSIQLQGE